MVETLWGQQHNAGEKPTVVMLYIIYINRHAGTPADKNKIKTFVVVHIAPYNSHIIYDNSAIDLHTRKPIV